MKNWNVVAVVRADGFNEALGVLREFGHVRRSRFFNVIEMSVANAREFIDGIGRKFSENPGLSALFSRLLPVEMAFAFSTAEEFREKAGESVRAFVPELEGKSFHVRIHRRGFKKRFSSPDEERFLDRLALDELERSGSPGRISFEDPDAIIAIETIEDRAGAALWSREDMARYPFIRVE